MPSLPFIRFFPSDYLADTTHLSCEEHGAYFLLLLNYWQTEKPLNDRNNRLANVVHLPKEKWEVVKQTLVEFFDITDDLWTHHRIEADLQAVLELSTKRSFAGKKGARSRANARLSVGTSPIKQELSKSSTSESLLFNYKDKDTDANADAKKNKERKINREIERVNGKRIKVRSIKRTPKTETPNELTLKRISKPHYITPNELFELSNP